MISFRSAIESDCKTLTELAQKTYVEAFGYSFQVNDLKSHIETYLSEETFTKIIQADMVLLAVEGKEIIGFVQFGPGAENEGMNPDNDWTLKRLYVLKEYQKRGIGSQLMERAIKQMKDNQVERVFLDVWEQNPGAIHFYQRFGFEVVGKRKFVVDSGSETSADLVMVLLI